MSIWACGLSLSPVTEGDPPSFFGNYQGERFVADPKRPCTCREVGE